MKHFFVRAIGLSLFIALLAASWSTLSAQDIRREQSIGTNPAQVDGVDQPQVTKTFVTDRDVAQIDIVSGTLDYQLFINSRADPNNWTLVDAKAVAQPTDPSLTTDVVLRQLNSHQMKLVLTANCDGCVAVIFK